MRTLSYGPGRQHRLDLTLPAGDGPHPVAFVLHGGFWRAKYKRVLMAPLCADLAARGWAAVNVEYRRVGRLRGGGGGVPATLEDVAAALDHLADVDAPLDLERVVSVGATSGDAERPWMGIVVNGQAQGQTPGRVTLPTGRHTIFVRRRGFSVDGDDTQTVDVPPRFSPGPHAPVSLTFQVRADGAPSN